MRKPKVAHMEKENGEVLQLHEERKSESERARETETEREGERNFQLP